MTPREKTEQIRRQIIQAASKLIYQKGFNLMSFSDIAEASKVPRGNIYYYFKTKDDVLEAVIDYRLHDMRMMLKKWEKNYSSPKDRLKRYARIPLKEVKNVLQYGCPIGSLNTELGKCQPQLQEVARHQFELFRKWIGEQFQMLVPQKNQDELALHLLVRTQGIAVAAHNFNDSSLIEQEVLKIEEWIDMIASSDK